MSNDANIIGLLFGVITAIIGLFTAIANRKKVIVNRNETVYRDETPTYYQNTKRHEGRSKGMVLFLCLLGFLGLHRFYLGQKNIAWVYPALILLYPILIAVLVVDFIGFWIMPRNIFDKKYNS
jgi:TM2 domain-containing membrane protein YozV